MTQYNIPHFLQFLPFDMKQFMSIINQSRKLSYMLTLKSVMENFDKKAKPWFCVKEGLFAPTNAFHKAFGEAYCIAYTKTSRSIRLKKNFDNKIFLNVCFQVYLPVGGSKVDTRKSNAKTPVPQYISTRTLKPVGKLHLQSQVYENFHMPYYLVHSQMIKPVYV